MKLVPREQVEAERAGWLRIASFPMTPAAVRNHARMMCELLDEVLMWRESAGCGEEVNHD